MRLASLGPRCGTEAYGYLANDITLFNSPEQMSAESVSAESDVVVGSGAAHHSRKLNASFRSEAGIAASPRHGPVMAGCGSTAISGADAEPML